MKVNNHLIRPGECLLSLAARHGLPVQKLMEANHTLLEKRSEPGILLPGDVAEVPDQEPGSVTRPTNQRHRFRLQRDHAEIRVRFRELGVPRAGEPYHVLIDGQRLEGQTPVTDDEGLVVCRIPPGAEKAIVVMGETEDEYELLLGHIDPIEEPVGIHGRLKNFGLYRGPIDTDYNGHSINAMEQFLSLRGQTGKISPLDYQNPRLQEELENGYGS